MKRLAVWAVIVAAFAAGCAPPVPEIVVRRRLVPCPPDPIRNTCEVLMEPASRMLADWLAAELDVPEALKCRDDVILKWETAQAACMERLELEE